MPEVETPPGATGAGADVVTEPQQILNSPPTETAQTVRRFDYAGVEANVAGDLQHRAHRIRRWIRRSFIDVGRELLKAKRHQLEHGQFIAGIETECGLNKRTAQRMMQAAAWVEGKSDTVSFLPPAVIYALSAASTPVEIHDALLGRIEAGERVEPQYVNSEIALAKRKAKEAAKRGRLTPEERMRVERREARRINAMEKDRREQEKRNANQDRVLDQLAELLINQIADQEHLLALLVEVGSRGIYLLRQRILEMGSP